MRTFRGFLRGRVGAATPGLGAVSPVSCLAIGLLSIGLAGCGEEEETRTLQPQVVGMTDQMPSVYDDGEVTLFEVKLPVAFPIKAPTAAEQASLNANPVAPYPSKPWVTTNDIKVQISWTLTNLDPDDHAVELLIDPWNEFGRYWPGMVLADANTGDLLPNLSGIDILMELPGTKGNRSSRRHGTFTFQDMNELATDFATVMNIIATAPPPDPMAEEDPTVTMVNHAFAIENKSYNDPFIENYIPPVVPGLTGVDAGLRTREAANIALELVVEVVDLGSGRVVARDSKDLILPEPTTYVTVGTGP